MYEYKPSKLKSSFMEKFSFYSYRSLFTAWVVKLIEIICILFRTFDPFTLNLSSWYLIHTIITFFFYFTLSPLVDDMILFVYNITSLFEFVSFAYIVYTLFRFRLLESFKWFEICIYFFTVFILIPNYAVNFI